MRRILLLLLLLLAATAFAQSPNQQPGHRGRRMRQSPKDYEAIKAEMADLAKAWNAGSVTAMSSHMADELAFLTPAGVSLKSRKELDAHHAEIMKKHFAGSRETLTVRDVHFLRPRVALCDVEVTITNFKSLPPGVPGKVGQPLHLLTRYILTRDSRDWLIVAAQSTLLHAPAGK